MLHIHILPLYFPESYDHARREFWKLHSDEIRQKSPDSSNLANKTGNSSARQGECQFQGFGILYFGSAVQCSRKRLLDSVLMLRKYRLNKE